MVLTHCKLKLREIDDTLKILEGSGIYHYMHERLKWVPRLLTVDQKQQHVDDYERC